MFHSKEAVLTTIVLLCLGVFVGCAAFNIAVEVEVNVIEEEAKEEIKKNPQSSQKKED